MAVGNDRDQDPFTNITIPRFYEDKNIFLTGGTGFIGKVLVEKLLRACPGIKNIYFLVRPKKGLSYHERIEKIFKLPLFSKLNELYPNAHEKLIPVPGDITHRGLGLSDEDRLLLQENVDIIIHSAATVRFDEPLRVAVEMNVIAVKEVMQLAREIKNLEVFCHISTAYSQCNKSKDEEIEERFYPVDVTPEKIIDCLSWMTDDMVNGFTKSLIGDYPNTYTFTKALAENMLEKEATDLPLLIVRPSIVSASVSDPFAGWIDNYNGVSGLIAAVGKGVLRTMHCPQCKNDIVPVDMVTNCIIAAVWYYGITGPSKPLICNCTSGNVNPTTFFAMEKICLPILLSYPYNSIFRRPNFAFTMNRFIHQYWQVISHYIPAIIADGLSILMGSKPRFMNVYRSIDRNLNTLQFFIQNEWRWGNMQYSRILKAVPEEDKENFNFDMRKIDWPKYYENLTLGVKVYLIKDDMSQLPKAIQLQKRYKMVRWLSSTIFILLAGRFFFLKSERFRKLWFEALYAIYRFLQVFRITSVHV